MSILIGGPGSTGSSLLRTVLNRHPDIFSGAELGFFNKEPVFTHWPKVKTKLLSFPGRRMTTLGWFPYAAHNLLHPDYGWDRRELAALLHASETFPGFVEAFFQRPLGRTGASLWIEKTPSNAYCFRHFLAQFPQGRVIHVTRNPLDAVASMTNRGMSPYFAAGNWVYNNAAALTVADDPRYHLITYEQMVGDPENTLQKLTDFVGFAFDSSMMQPRQEEEKDVASIDTWTYASTDRIKRPEKSTFESSSEDRQAEILTALTLFRIHPSHVRKNGFKQKSAAEVSRKLGYKFTADTSRILKINKQYLKDVLKRTTRFYGTHLFNNPGSLASLKEAG